MKLAPIPLWKKSVARLNKCIMMRTRSLLILYKLIYFYIFHIFVAGPLNMLCLFVSFQINATDLARQLDLMEQM